MTRNYILAIKVWPHSLFPELSAEEFAVERGFKPYGDYHVSRQQPDNIIVRLCATHNNLRAVYDWMRDGPSHAPFPPGTLLFWRIDERCDDDIPTWDESTHDA